MHIKPILAVLAGLFFISHVARAQEPENTGTVVTPSSTATRTWTIHELERIQAETVLYEARAARAKAIISWQQNGNGLDAPMPVIREATDGKKNDTQVVQVTRKDTLPRILEIAGSGNRLKSRMQMADGTVVEVAPGQRLPGTTYTVQQITASGVRLKSDDGTLHSPSFSE